MRGSWTTLVSRRWFDSRTGNAGTSSSLLASAGIAIGVAALVVVLAVMNGFQMGYMDSILEVSSFHARVVDSRPSGGAEDLSGLISGIEGVRSVLPFEEGWSLVSSTRGRALAMKVLVLPPDFALRDPGFAAGLGLAGGGFDRGGDPLLGSEAARQLGLLPGDSLTLALTSSTEEGGFALSESGFTLGASFTSNYYQFDSGLLLLPAPGPGLSPAHRIYGVKLVDGDATQAFVTQLEALAAFKPGGPFRVEVWRDYNRAFFGALRTEKTVMLILVGLIFLVVGVNIHHAMRRMVASRGEDLAVLRSLGASPESLRSILALNGAVTGLRGSLAGLALGLFVSVNINAIVELFGGLLDLASRVFAGSGSLRPGLGESVFYLQSIPVRSPLAETLMIAFVATASAILAALSAARRAGGKSPSELLRHE